MTFTKDELDSLDDILWRELRRADTMIPEYYEAIYDLREKVMRHKCACP